MSAQKPSIGRIVLVPVDPKRNNGADVAPAVITLVWNDTCVNVRVLTDSAEVPDWRTSLVLVDELPSVEPGVYFAPGVWAWPPRV